MTKIVCRRSYVKSKIVLFFWLIRRDKAFRPVLCYPCRPPPHTSSTPPNLHQEQENGAIHFLYQVKYIHNFYSFNIFLSFRLLYTSQWPSDRATYYYLGYEEDEKNIPRAKEDKITLVHQEKIYNRTEQ